MPTQFFFKYMYYYYSFHVLLFKFLDKWNLFFNCIAIVEANHVMPAVFVALCHHFFSTSYNFKFDNIARGKDTRGPDVNKKMIALKVD